MTQTDVLYNVECGDCGAVFQPQIRASLWWQAKQRVEVGKLDALYIRGEECGCIKKVCQPNAPFRVFGYDDMGREYDQPFPTFVSAIKAFIEANHYGEIVFITGVSQTVQDKLKWWL